MTPQLTANTLTACFTVTLETLEILVENLNTPFLGVISVTAQSLLDNFEVILFNQPYITVNLSCAILGC